MSKTEPRPIDARQAFFSRIKELKAEHNIHPVRQAGDKERRRIAILVTEALLEQGAQEIGELLSELKLGSVAGSKPLQDVERGCFMAGIFESRLYDILTEHRLSCDPIEHERRSKSGSDPLKLTVESEAWRQGWRGLNLPLVNETINRLIGKDGRHERAHNVEEHHLGESPFGCDGAEETGLGSFAGQGASLCGLK